MIAAAASIRYAAAMDEPETLMVGDMSVSVEETDEALTYTFSPRPAARKPTFPVSVLVVFVLYPLGLMALTVYARSRAANRPEWEDVLSGVLLAQLLVWLIGGTSLYATVFVWPYRHSGVVLRFTRTHVWHGDYRICELEQVRGLRFFVYTSVTRYLMDLSLPRTDAAPDPKRIPLPPEFGALPPDERPPSRPEAALSLVIDGDTHSLAGGFDPDQVRALAEHIHRRLTKFRFNQGIVAALDPLSAVETTEDDVQKLTHTRPPVGTVRRMNLAVLMIFGVRWTAIVWCTAMLAGLFASARLVVDTGLNGAFVLGYGPAAITHAVLLAFHLSVPQVKTKKGDPEETL
jgi:hypothetical protein